MILEVNHEHKKMDASTLKKSIKKFKIGLLGTTIAISLFSGAMPKKAYAAETKENITTEYQISWKDIPEEQLEYVYDAVNKTKGEEITEEDLEKVNYMFIKVDNENISLDYLKHFPNLQAMNIYFSCDNTKALETIPQMKRIETIEVSNLWNDCTITKEQTEFIKNNPTLKEVKISNIYIEPGCEENLNQLESIMVSGCPTYDIDFTKLNHIKTLDLSKFKPYDLAVFLNSKEYETLKNNGVDIIFESDESKEQFLRINHKLDEIVTQLDVSESSSNQEKLDAILIYVLEKLNYDKDIADAVTDGVEHQELTNSFYEGGRLYGALEKESAICGNYASLVEALMDRLELENASSILESRNHAWNIVKVEGEPYYVDATWLEGQTTTQYVSKANPNSNEIEFIKQGEKLAQDYIKEHDTSNLNWYLEEIDEENIASIDKKSSHIPMRVPTYMLEKEETTKTEDIAATTIEETTEIDKKETDNIEQEETDITNKKFKIHIGKKELIIGGAALVGILTALGIAMKVKDKKDREAIRRMYQEQRNYSNEFDSWTFK